MTVETHKNYKQRGEKLLGGRQLIALSDSELLHKLAAFEHAMYFILTELSARGRLDIDEGVHQVRYCLPQSRSAN